MYPFARTIPLKAPERFGLSEKMVTDADMAVLAHFFNFPEQCPVLSLPGKINRLANHPQMTIMTILTN